jgi:hypothetical protein
MFPSDSGGEAATDETMKITTNFVYPPIPLRQFDWCAYDDDTYDGPGSILGHGRTEAEAVADFREQWEEKHGAGDPDAR